MLYKFTNLIFYLQNNSISVKTNKRFFPLNHGLEESKKNACRMILLTAYEYFLSLIINMLFLLIVIHKFLRYYLGEFV